MAYYHRKQTTKHSCRSVLMALVQEEDHLLNLWLMTVLHIAFDILATETGAISFLHLLLCQFAVKNWRWMILHYVEPLPCTTNPWAQRGSKFLFKSLFRVAQTNLIICLSHLQASGNSIFLGLMSKSVKNVASYILSLHIDFLMSKQHCNSIHRQVQIKFQIFQCLNFEVYQNPIVTL